MAPKRRRPRAGPPLRFSARPTLDRRGAAPAVGCPCRGSVGGSLLCATRRRHAARRSEDSEDVHEEEAIAFVSLPLAVRAGQGSDVLDRCNADDGSVEHQDDVPGSKLPRKRSPSTAPRV